MDVVRFVIQYHEILERLDPLQHGALTGRRQVLRGLSAQKRLDGVVRRPFLVTRLVELLDIGQKEIS